MPEPLHLLAGHGSPEVPFCPGCGYVTCVCEIRTKHSDGCRFRRAASLSFELECEHGLQACPICDSCDCGAGENRGVL
jgi:hypothetical protein